MKEWVCVIKQELQVKSRDSSSGREESDIVACDQ